VGMVGVSSDGARVPFVHGHFRPWRRCGEESAAARRSCYSRGCAAAWRGCAVGPVVGAGCYGQLARCVCPFGPVALAQAATGTQARSVTRASRPCRQRGGQPSPTGSLRLLLGALGVSRSARSFFLGAVPCVLASWRSFTPRLLRASLVSQRTGPPELHLLYSDHRFRGVAGVKTSAVIDATAVDTVGRGGSVSKNRFFTSE
jgi:hypothetical protein